MCKEIALEEVEKTLELFAKEKSPGPDGWTVELFLHFFDMMGDEILQMVEYTREQGHVSGALNATFITLIPKVSDPKTFGDFRPISLCNLVYKIVSKIIVGRLKPVLSKFITPEQFGFLEDHQIHDDVGITQELLHSIKCKKLKAILLKIDLEKAYDRVSWDFLRIILIQIGVPASAIQWIMACVTSMSIAVLVNGAPTSFFSCSRELRQGCPMSPLLFLLVIDGLSKLINLAQREGKIKGLKISNDLFISRAMFVDDVLLAGIDSLEDWRAYQGILDLFCKASGMKISLRKSCFYENYVDEEHLAAITSLMPFKCCKVVDGFTYLGFQLKPNGYLLKEWHWLIQKFESRISHWTFRLLSIGGKLTLVKSVLMGTPVYWFSLLPVPCLVINTLRKLIFNFLWTGGLKKSSLSMIMISWDKISLPETAGGWGLKDLSVFSAALRLKSLWRAIFGTSLWSRVIQHK